MLDHREREDETGLENVRGIVYRFHPRQRLVNSVSRHGRRMHIAVMRRTAWIALLTLIALPARPCSTFCLARGGEAVFGRNYDFEIGNGFVMTKSEEHTSELQQPYVI